MLLPRPCHLLIAFSAWMMTGHVHARTTTAADPAYARFKAVAVKNAADGLRALAAEWSTSPVAHERHLGLAAAAFAEFRADDFPACLQVLDRADSLVPHSDTIVFVLLKRCRSKALTMLGDTYGGEQQAIVGAEFIGSAPFIEERTMLWLDRAEALLMRGEFDAAQEWLHRTGHLADSIGYRVAQSGVANDLGLICLNQARYDEASRHFRTAFDVARSGGQEMAAQNSLTNLGIIATMTERYDEAIQLYDSLLRALGGRSPQLRAWLHDGRGFVYRRMNANDKAIACFDEALRLMDSLGDERSRVKVEEHLAAAFWNQGRHEAAIGTLERSLAAAERLAWADLCKENHIQLYDWYYELGRKPEALEHLRAYTELADSLNAARFDTELARSEALFETGRKERRLAEQQQALDLAASEDHRKSLQRDLLIGLAVALVIVAGLFWRLARSRKQRIEQASALHEKEVDGLLQQHEIKAMHAMFEGQEKERDRVARDLHDRVGSMLGNVKMQMEVLEERMGTDHREREDQYHKVYGLLVETVGEVRRISHDMVAGTLARFGLEKALEGLCDSVRVTGHLAVELRVFGLENRLERGVEITVYRIVQELVGNALKHAKAGELSISLTRTPGRLSVIVSDNGEGFDPSTPSEGMGLANVRQRAVTIGGEVTVDSTPGKGTTVSVECAVVE